MAQLPIPRPVDALWHHPHATAEDALHGGGNLRLPEEDVNQCRVLGHRRVDVYILVLCREQPVLLPLPGTDDCVPPAADCC